MKNSQKGFLVPLLIIIIAVLMVGVGAYYFSYKNAINQTLNATTSLKIANISPLSISVGTQVTVKGTGFNRPNLKIFFDRISKDEPGFGVFGTGVALVNYNTNTQHTIDISPDGTTLSFTLPHEGYKGGLGGDSKGSIAGLPPPFFSPGTYQLYFKTNDSISNKMTIIVVDSTTTTSPQGSINVTYPKGGESFHVGQVVTVTWNTQNISGNIYVNLINGGKSFGDSNKPILASQGSYQWTVPDETSWGVKNGFQIVVNTNSNPEIMGRSGVFSIVK